MTHRSLYTVTAKRKATSCTLAATNRASVVKNSHHHKAIILIGFLLLQMGVALAEAASNTQHFDIPRQRADDALTALGQQAGVTVVYRYETVNQYYSNAVQGEMTLSAAVRALLKNTGLTVEIRSGGHLIISQEIDQGQSVMNSKKKLLASTIAFFVGGSGSQLAFSQSGVGEESSGWLLEEVVVTATRRETSLQDAAASIAAVGSEEIDRKGISGMEDYLATIPGVSFLEGGVSQNNFVIRGIASEPEAESNRAGPSVGLYFGEVPLAGLNILGGGVNMRLVDMDRVEILRGPQGTLFGAGSLSGAVRNIPSAPSLEEVEGRVKAGYSKTSGNGSDNHQVEGVVNIPLIEDVLAVRASVYRHENSGYIKNIVASDPTYSSFLNSFGVGAENDESDIGASEYTGGRFAALWRASDELSVSLQYVEQEGIEEGFPQAQLNTGGYTQTRVPSGRVSVQSPFSGDTLSVSSGEGSTVDLSFTNLVIDYDFGWASLLSSTTWLESKGDLTRDISIFFGAPVVQAFQQNTDGIVQEVRLVSSLDGPFQYIAGIYYEDKESDAQGPIPFVGDLALSPFGDPLGAGNALLAEEVFESNFKQEAFFIELSYELTDQLKLTVGGRQFDYERDQLYLVQGLFGDNTAAGGEFIAAEESGSSYKANLSYSVDESSLLYVQWAEGFRPGSYNSPVPTDICDIDNDGVLDGTNIPISDSFDADTLESYELGVKSAVADGRVQVNASVFQNNWEGIPIEVTSPTCLFSQVGNAGEAETQGVEVEAVIGLLPELRLFLGGAYINTELKNDTPEVGAESGDRLPGSPEYSWNLGVQYDFDLMGYPSYLRTDYAYVGGFYNNLAEEGTEVGDYGKLDLKMGVAFESWTLEIFGKNLTDSDDLTWVGTFVVDDRVNRLRPRTIGVNVTYNF